jgi:hypothetical protein
MDKVHDIVALYLDPPERAVVLCVDEKSQIQALDRTQPILPLLSGGTPERRSHDYTRHGVTSLFAALNATTGEVIGQLRRRHRAEEFRRFLNLIDASVPAHLDVHVVVDNSSTRKAPTIHRWLVRHPASRCTSPPPTPAGRTRSSAGSPSSPPLVPFAVSNAGLLAGCRQRRA